MPQAIPVALAVGASAAGAGAAAGGITIAGVVLSSTALTAISVGLSVAGALATTLLAETPDKPRMQDGDVSIKQAIPPRTRMYGRQRLGGVYLYYDSTPDGDLKTLVCHAAHEVDDSTEGNPNPEEDWLNDERVQLDEGGQVTDDPWWQPGTGFGGDDGHSVVVIQHYLGSPTQVIPSFDEKWTAEHKAHGLCCAYVKYADLKDEDQIKAFPSGPPPYRAVLRGAKVYDPRTAQDPEDEATWAWSDNAALVLLDYLTRLEQGVPVGFGVPLTTRIDLASFAASADICDQAIPIKIEGEVVGTEKRWRSWGAYELTEDKKAVLQDLLDACGGRLIQGPDGKLGLTVGAGPYRAMDEDAFTVPTGAPAASVTLTEEHILEWDLNQGKPAIERINEVRATYVSQAWEWAETEAGIQQDTAGQARNGVESSQVKLRFVPSESQAQRVAREVLRRGNPSHAGRIRTTLAGLDAWGERWIHLVIAELDIDGLFEITSMSLNQADMTVSMEVASYDDWWTWTAETDEQLPAVPPPNSDDDAEVPVPEGVAVDIIHRLVNGQTYVAVGLITWDPPPRSVYVGKARYRPLSPAGSPWQPLPVAQDSDQVETFPLEDGIAYEAQVRFIGPRGAGSDWSASATFTAVADPNAPAAPSVPLASPVGATTALQTTAPNSANVSAIRFWRDSDNVFAGAADISGPIYTAPNSLATFTDTPGPGAWYYWATAENWSGIRSAAAGPTGPVTFTPAAPVIVSPTTPYVTSDNTPTFSGTAPNATTVHLFDGVTDVGSVAVVTGAWNITASTLADGTRNVTAKAVAPGPVSSVASNTVVTTIDTVVSPPVITTSSPLSTTDTTPDISGTSENGAAIAMFRGGSTAAGTATANGSGNWTATLSPALAVGSYSITAKQTDTAGNVSGASSALTLNVQPVAPAITTVGATTYDTTPTIAGTSTASATIKLYDDGVLSATSTADGSGNWTFPTGVLATGANVITATQTVSGIESPASSGITMTITALDSDAAAYIAAMTTEPSSARMGLINDLVVGLKADGAWTSLDALYLLAAADAQAACLNVKAPSTFTLTPTASPVFTVDRGFKGTSSGASAGGYLASAFNPATAGGGWAQNSAHMGVHVRTAATTNLTATSCEIGNSGAFIYTKHATAGTITTLLNNASSSAAAAGTPNSLGHYILSRTASTGYDRYHDGVAQAAVTATSTAVASSVMNVLRRGASIGYSDAEVSAAHWGAGLNATLAAAVTTRVHTYLVAVGAA